MKNLGLQLYSVRDIFKTEEDAKHIFSELAKYGYNEIEPAGFPIELEKMAEIAKQEGLRIISVHYSWDEIVNNTEKTAELFKKLDCKFVGVGGLGKALTSKENLLGFIEEANQSGKKLSEYGMKFIYHNHNTEFKKLDGKTYYSYMAEGFDGNYANLELDVYWAQHAGIDVCDLIRKLKGKTGIIHLKDMAACYHADDFWFPDICEIGFGNMNFKGIIEEAEKIGVEHFIVEQDYNWRKSPLESAKESAEYLRNNFGF